MKRDIKINYGKIEDIVYELNKYYEALTSMKKTLKNIQQNLKNNESKAIDALSNNFTSSDKNINTCQKEIEDVKNILINYKDAMQQYSQAVIYYNLMEVDRNDISVNISDIGKSYGSILDGISYGKRNIRGSSSKNKDAIRNEQHNAQEIEWLNRKADSIADKLSEYMDDLWGIHKNKVIPFEDTDDDFKGKAWDLYWKYNGLGKWLGDFFGSATEAIKNLLRGAIDGIMDIIEGTLSLAKGILLYTGSVAILVSADKMPLTCKWAKNYFDDTNNKIGAILNDPGTVIEGIAQGVSDAVDNKGIFYSVGYIIPSVFGEKGLDKAGDVIKGLGGVEEAGAFSKISKTEEILKAGNVESKVTEGVKGLGGTKGIGKIKGMDGVEEAIGIDSALMDYYKNLRTNKDIPGQAHHLNQYAAFRDVIPKKEGLAIKLEGNVRTDINSPHYNAHKSLEGFWNKYRKGGASYGAKPTISEYNLALYDSLKSAELSEDQVAKIVSEAIKQQLDYGLLGEKLIPRIPGRINFPKLK